MNIAFALLSWPFVALLAFKRMKPAQAALLTVLGGWLVLPVGIYPDGAHSSAFPYWLVGSAVPSDMLITKAWIAPASAMLAILLTDFRRLSSFKFSPLDLPMLAWCLWPLAQAVFTSESKPDSLVASAYLIGAWGLPWLIGRMYFSDAKGQRLLITGLAWSGIACLPFALWEGLFGPDLYAVLYEAHPFAKDGSERYIGWRPIGFFENGNQYGLWVCLCALAAIWLWRSAETAQGNARWQWGAGIAVGMALVSQAVGALILLALGCVGMSLAATVQVKRFVIGALVVVLALSAVYLSGAAPITHWGKETAIGRKVVDGFKASGRGSLPWRISQDQKAIALVKPDAVLGRGTWDWWSILGTRPWGLALLVVGQFGVIGFLLAFGAVASPALKTMFNIKIENQWGHSGAPTVLAAIVLLALMDAVLNSFFFFPALMVAAALVPTTSLATSKHS